MITFIGRLCDREFSEDQIPAEAVKQAGSSRHSALYLLPDGIFHDLKPKRTQKQRDMAHRRWHTARGINVSGCEFCDERRKQLESTPAEPDPVQVFLEEENPTGQMG